MIARMVGLAPVLALLIVATSSSSLSLWCMADEVTAPTDAPRMTPENDRCVDATLLRQGVPVNGDNTNANFDFVNQGVCGPRSDRRALWYEIIGSGKNATVYVCTNNDKITDYGIFEVCNTQLCEGAPPQLAEPANCEDDEANIFTFFAEDGEDYFVHVRSDTLDPEGSNFTIWYTESSDEPPPGPSGGLRLLSSMLSTTFVALVSGAIASCISASVG